MERKIIIRSDYETLMSVKKEAIQLYLKDLMKTNKKQIKQFTIFGILSIISIIIANYNMELFVFVLFSISMLAVTFINLIHILIKAIIVIIKYNRQFDSFKDMYQGVNFVNYTLYEDFIEYEGHKNETYPWSGYYEVSVNPNNFWILNHDINKNIYIPKICLVNADDYDYLKEFAQLKIKEQTNQSE